MERFKTPWVECMYPFLQAPKVDRNGEYEDSFEITLILGNKNQDHKDLLNHLVKLQKESGGTQTIGDKKHPIKLQKDDNGKVIPDTFLVRFKSKAEFCDHIPTFDAKGDKILREKNFVANGSVVRVNWTYGFYTQGGGGVSLFLNGVQIKELIEWEGHSAEDLGFDKTEGYSEIDKPTTDGRTEPPDPKEDSTREAQSETMKEETGDLQF